MKLLTLLLSIAVLSSGLAQNPPKDFYKGTLTYLNGKTEEAYIKCPASYTINKIKIVRMGETDDTKINSDELKTITLTTGGGSHRFDHLNMFLPNGKIDKEKYWFYWKSNMSCPAVSAYAMGQGFEINKDGGVVVSSTKYIGSKDYMSGAPINIYIKKFNEENAHLIGGNTKNKYWQRAFADEPEILKKIKAGKYGKMAYGAILDDYCEIHKGK